MAHEKGIVTRVGSGTAWVKTVRTSACESCSSKHTCTTLGGGNEMEVEAIDAVGTRIGDRVVISFKTGSLLKLTFLVYVFPILCLLAGATLGQELAPRYQVDTSTASVVGGLIGFALSFFPIRLLGSRLSGKDRYQPKIVRIDRRTSTTTPQPLH